jgi:hypothetical protein
MTVTASRTPPPEWIALADGIAHAQPARGRRGTACGLRRIDPRYAHPATGRCLDCLATVGITVRR